MRSRKGVRHAWGVGLAAATMVVGLISVGVTASGAAVQPHALKGTLNVAEGPDAAPDSIFPFVNCDYYSVSNITQFQYLMYRPLYFYGLGNNTGVDYAISLGNKPAWNSKDTQETITLKGGTDSTTKWKFSNGQQIDAESVAFALNMWAADPGDQCASAAPRGIPYQIKSVSYPHGLSGNEVVLNFKSSINPNWFDLNMLSALVPMPEAWDITHNGAAAGSGHCASDAFGSSAAEVACADLNKGVPNPNSVEGYLDSTAYTPPDWTSAPWNVYSGPWALSSADSLGDVTLVPNAAYSGPQKASLQQVNLVPFSGANATATEEIALADKQLSLGFVDPSDLPGPAKAGPKAGPNLADLNGAYDLTVGAYWGFNYGAYDMENGNPGAVLVRQQYIREALQGMVNEPALIKASGVDNGYGYLSCSPLPVSAPAAYGKQIPCAYPFTKGAAFYKGLLTKHGWVEKSGVMECEKTGTKSNECGAGIAKNRKLIIRLDWTTGTPSLNTEMDAQIKEWNSIGIGDTVTDSRGFDTVIFDCGDGKGAPYDLCEWGGGWEYSPDLYPSGEWAFSAGASYSYGYSDPHMTALVNASIDTKVNLNAFDEYAAAQVPVLYEPTPVGTGEQSVNVTNPYPVSPLNNFTPEYISCHGPSSVGYCNPS